MNKNHKNKRKGFTLLEILLVIAAIGILAAIVLVAINPTRQIAQVRNAQRRSDINAIYKALEQYLIDNQTYPTDITDSKKVICDTGSKTTTDTLEPIDCTDKVDLRVLVPTYLAEIPTDPSGGVYEVYINSENNRIAVESKDAELNQGIVINPIVAQINNITCPNNYILVPGSSLYGTTDFCVMKYEAKAGSSTVPATTQAEDPPYGTSQTLSRAACNLNNTGGVTGYSLINNAEYMTIARNIEAQPSNWTGGSVGDGGLFKGHSDDNPVGVLEAITDDSDGYLGTGNDSNNGVEQKRTHTLSNGQVIWDLSGNLWEWTDNIIMGSQKPTLGGGGIQEWTNFNALGASYGSLSYDLTRPSNSSWNSAQNMGKYFDQNLTGGPYAFMRGGVYHSLGSTDPYATTGIFTLLLDYGPDMWSDGGPVTGRCVFR